jgi:DNA processing protein
VSLLLPNQQMIRAFLALKVAGMASIDLSELSTNFDKILEKINSKDWSRAEALIETCQNQDISIIGFSSEAYPPLLRFIPDPPIVLFCKGNIKTLTSKISVAVVGMRNSSPYGESIAKEIGELLPLHGVTVVSGLARGIDAEVHQAACRSISRAPKIEGENYTSGIAVLGSGLEIIYPVENQKLSEELLSTNGCLVSEFEPQEPPRKYHFPKRNRIVAGMSIATVVIEAGEKSGSLITARLAGEFGRDIYAVPGMIHREGSQGTNRLLADGARLLLSPRELLQFLGVEKKQLKQKVKSSSVAISKESSDQHIILEVMRDVDSISVEELQMRQQLSSMSHEKLLVTLQELELDGQIRRVGGDFFTVL